MMNVLQTNELKKYHGSGPASLYGLQLARGWLVGVWAVRGWEVVDNELAF